MGILVDAWSLVSTAVSPFSFFAATELLLSQNMGQNCIGIERLIVHVDQYDDLFAIFSERVAKMRVGSVMSTAQAGYLHTVDGGAMITADRFRGIEKLIRDASDANAYVIGGEEYKHVYHEHGYYFQPTVVGPVDATMDIANQERARPSLLEL